jgi:hypothetical protein
MWDGTTGDHRGRDTDQDYGSRDSVAQDPAGNIWSFGTYGPALS